MENCNEISEKWYFFWSKAELDGSETTERLDIHDLFCFNYEKKLNLVSWVKLTGIPDSCSYKPDSTSELSNSGERPPLLGLSFQSIFVLNSSQGRLFNNQIQPKPA